MTAVDVTAESRLTGKTMRAASLAGNRKVETTGAPIPSPGAGQMLVRIEGSGVCASNLPVWEGREWFNYPFEAGAPGHEPWGVVERLGDGVTKFREGDRIAFLSGHAYAEYDVTDEGSAVLLPDSLRSKPFPGEAIGCAMNIFRRSDIQPGHDVAIVGVGFLGALLARLATNAGARVIAVSRRQFSLDIAKQYGAAETIPMDDHWKIIEKVKELTGGQFCHRVIEAVGKQWPLDLAGELTRERGKLIIAGYHQDSPRSVNMQLWNWRGLDVVNAHERDPKVYAEGIRMAVEAVASGALDPFPLLRTYPLGELGEALRATEERPDGFVKAVVVSS